MKQVQWRSQCNLTPEGVCVWGGVNMCEHEYECARVLIGTCMPTHTHKCGGQSLPRSLPLSYFLRQGHSLSLNLEITDLTGLTGQPGILRIRLSLCATHPQHCLSWLFLWVLRIQTQALKLAHSKHFTHSAIFQVPMKPLLSPQAAPVRQAP